MVDSRVRDQSSPSLVDHNQNTIGYNQWSKFIKIKKENIYTFPHTTMLLSFPSRSSLTCKKSPEIGHRK